MNVRLAMVAVAVLLLGDAGYIEAKAMLAQQLIEHAWNKTLTSGAPQRPWHWADTWPVARIRSTRLGSDLFVLAGADGGSLAFGPGHFSHTAVPGREGTSVIAGHRDTHFRFLAEVAPGDEFQVQRTDGVWRVYRVTETLIVNVEESPVWAAVPDRNEMHLITCYPFDAVAPGGPLRMVVISRRACQERAC